MLLALLIGLVLQPPSASADDFAARLSSAALARDGLDVIYDGAYRRIDYPGGDVPANVGVCTDLVIRAFRAVGVDLQRVVHEDMRAAFEAYPSRRIWGLTRPDPNIDHRRVPNLQAWLVRHGSELPVTHRAEEYRPGDVVTWMLPGNLPHIGIVVDRRNAADPRPLVAHNIGAGPKIEDRLFVYRLTGHYRYAPHPE